jgi:hypothetical protein
MPKVLNVSKSYIFVCSDRQWIPSLILSPSNLLALQYLSLASFSNASASSRLINFIVLQQFRSVVQFTPSVLDYLSRFFSFAVEQLTCSQSFLDRTQQTAVAAVYGAAILP